MLDILEIDKSANYKVGSTIISGDDVIHLIANGIRYEEFKKSIGGTQK